MLGRDNKRFLRAALVLALAVAVCSSTLFGATATMNGGGVSSCASYIIRCGIGQAVAGHTSSDLYGFDCGYLSGPPPGPPPLCGDADATGSLDIDDVVFLIQYIFAGGDPPNPLAAGDADCTGGIDIDDVVLLINYIFNGGPEPCSDCGEGPPAAKKVVGRAELIASVCRGDTDSKVSLSISSDVDIQAVQLEFEVPRGVTDVRVESDLDGVSMFHGTFDGRLKVGVLDLYGKTMVPSDGSEIVRIVHGGKGDVELAQQLLVPRDGGAIETVLKITESTLLPDHYVLRQSTPNPFNPTTEISFSLPEASRVSLRVYNILGRKVKTLVDEHLPAGDHSVVWDGSSDNGDLSASGVYFYRLEAGRFSDTKKMVMLK